MLETLIPVACFVVGAVFGAWLFHRSRAGESPPPTLADVFPPKPPEEQHLEPRIKP